jgi:hypothetical protein
VSLAETFRRRNARELQARKAWLARRAIGEPILLD